MRKITSYAIVVFCLFIFCGAEAAFSSGSLQVAIGPQGAIDAGAQWRRVGTSTWFNSGTTETDIPAGQYSVEFSTVVGWTKPGNRTLTINDGQTAHTSVTYTQQWASLVVTIIPDEAVDAGAQWRVDGGSWLGSGETQSVFVGEHLLEFRDVTGWTKPDNGVVSLSQARTTLLTVAYVLQTGSLQVTIEPQGAIDAGAQWRRVGTSTWRDSGTTEPGIPVGDHTVEFKDISGWAKPENQTLTISENQTATAAGIYVPVPISITVTTPNGGENWAPGTTHTISWTYVGNPGNYVKIELFKSGVLDRTIISSHSIGSEGSGSYPWVIASTQPVGNDYQVKVTSTTNSAYTDTSNANFTITAPPGPSITVATPNGGENWAPGTTQTISWTYVGTPGNYVRIQLFKSGVLYRNIVSSRSIGTGGSGSYPWAIPSTQPGGSDYQVKVTSTTNSAYTDASNANFTIPGPLPVVTVIATDGSATEAGSATGMYRISRTGATVSSLSVFFAMGGSAQNGVDYNAITSPVTIPAGASYVFVTLRPIDDSVDEANETAILTISPDPNYVIGSSSSATVTIQDND